MQGFPHARRRFADGLRRLGLATALVWGVASPASAAVPADPSEPGAYCEIGQCRPVSASLWTPVAFAATVVVIGSRARRGARRL